MQSTSLKKINSSIDSIISGEKTRKLLIENIGNTIKDLIFYLPYKLIKADLCKYWSQLEDKKRVILNVTVNNHYSNFRKTKIPYTINVVFDGKPLKLIFFSKYTGYLKDLYEIGTSIFISGTLAIYNNKFQILHPTVLKSDDIKKNNNDSLVTLFYRQKAGLKSKIIHKSILKILPHVPPLKEWNQNIFKEFPLLPSWIEAIKNLHMGKDANALDSNSIFLLRLAYDEILSYQLSLAIIRKNINQENSNHYKKDSKSIIYPFVNLLQYQLTKDQESNILEIIKDLNNDTKMLRILHGDVGSGKTIVAIISALHVIYSGYQVVLLAPTEILANQHYDLIFNKLEKIKYKVCLLSASSKNKKQILENIANGYYNFIIGTHSLLQKDVIFKNLSYVIIDEQHRFGVEQRINIRKKGKNVDMLLLSATPIPRTMLLANLGDISTSTIKNKPFKNNVKTILKSDKNIEEVIKFIKSNIKNSKVFWICPMIEDNEEETNSSSVQNRYKLLKNAFRNIGFLHGKLKIENKNKILNMFKSGEMKLLISTVVVEVGIDIPDANIIIIDHADRFGLAQIHQLRGRVGRGNQSGTCVLLYKEPLKQVAIERLKIIKESNNGFDLAEKDLQMRGGGEILGKNQYGFQSFNFFNFLSHSKLLKIAIIEAKEILERDPFLKSERGRALFDLLYLFHKDKVIDLISAG